MRKIVVMIPEADQYRDRFEAAAAGRAQLIWINPEKEDEVVPEDADAIIGAPSRHVVHCMKQLKWLQATFAGVEGYVSDPQFPEDAVLTNATGAFGVVISEYILAGILASCRRLYQYKDQQRKECWRDAGSETMLYGKRALILGAGDIGSQTAKRLAVFDVYTVGMRRTPQGPQSYFQEIIGPEALDSELAQADFVIGCLPSTSETIHMLDERRLHLMKQGAMLVNVGRGSLIDTDALVKELENGHISSAVLDVFEQEPLPADHPLWKMEQVCVTPHISGQSFGHGAQTQDAVAGICIENLDRYLSGKPLKNRVSFAYGYAEKNK